MPTETGDTPLTFDSPELWTGEGAAQDESPTSTTTSDDATPTASTPESATVSPVDTPTEGEQQPRASKQGPIPYERHEAILAKQRGEAEAKWNRVAWAAELADRGATKERVQRALGIEQALDANPVQLIQQLLIEATNRPDLAEQVRSIAGRVLGTAQQQAVQQQQPQVDQDPKPQPDFYTQLEDGTRKLFYSQEQQDKLDEWHQRQVGKKLDERFAPFEQERQQKIAQAERDQIYQSYYQPAKAQWDALKQIPLFVQNRDKVEAYIKSQGYTITPNEAWLNVLHSQVLPNLDQTARAAERADLRTQAAASSVNPKVASTSRPGQYKSFDDIPKDKW